jgi:PBSX family phage terminase large subunit
MSWWHPLSPVKDQDGIIADGSVRAGKTFPMSMSFIEFAFHYFDKQSFILSGKTVGSFRRNVLFWLKPILSKRGYKVQDKRQENILILSKNGKENTFYIFGGRDESSQDLVQGLTAAGAYFDEVALMPESFVNQAIARCSLENAKLFFNCNPGGPSHWFKLRYLDLAKEKQLLHLHFLMPDNPSLSPKTLDRYQRMWPVNSVFYKRYILGLWVMAEGAIFDSFSPEQNVYSGNLTPVQLHYGTHYITVDVGTQNATVFLHVLDDGERLWVLKEYYHSGRDSGHQKTNSMYADDFVAFCQGIPVHQVIIDPSAASFKAELKLKGFRLKDAKNDVLEGIKHTSSMFGLKLIMIHDGCKNLIREVQGYVWDPKPTEKGNEKPLKVNDHGPDALRYICFTIFKAMRFMGVAA